MLKKVKSIFYLVIEVLILIPPFWMGCFLPDHWIQFVESVLGAVVLIISIHLIAERKKIRKSLRSLALILMGAGIALLIMSLL